MGVGGPFGLSAGVAAARSGDGRIRPATQRPESVSVRGSFNGRFGAAGSPIPRGLQLRWMHG